MNATVVSAYYEISSKYPPEYYQKWIRLFLENVPCYLVFFCEEKHYKFISECRRKFQNRTRIIILDREDHVSNKNFSPEFWLQQFYLDPEMELHTIELYKIWYEKKEFVRKAIEMNPFNHTKFLWTDAGIIRNADAPYMMRGYPNVRKIPDDKMLVLCVEPFHDDDGVDFAKLDRLAGGVIAGSVNVWNEWLDLYGDVVNRYAEEKLFIGKEQNVINAMYIERKDLFELLQKRESGAFDKWRYILRYLGS